ncbi:hypothetical protein [Allokutzneria albata]|uniref:HEAT repeat-containing protein n=1 Tax=Allokutzneria albata TaxID=211114 RepID=A0A1G9WDJ7_ALLAB|nr:hypothetical protein [Allokutzneria albata]SDM82321.1 hypothetical protein SAMN04489726_3534 [Allokutzneria albata]
MGKVFAELRAMLTSSDPEIRWKVRKKFQLRYSEWLDETADPRKELDAVLLGSDPEARERVADLYWSILPGAEIDHAEALLDVLEDDSAAVAARELCAELFILLVPGEESHYMVDRLAEKAREGVSDWLAAAFGIAAGDLPRFTNEQAGDGATVRCFSCELGMTGPEPRGEVSVARCWRVSALVALLGSRSEWVRRRAVRELALLGSGVVGVLRAVCRSRTPSRRGALAVLAEIGWHELDPADRELLTRFIRIRQRGETPAPLAERDDVFAEWFAVPTTDQAAVLEAFDLCDPVPATMRMGQAWWSVIDGWRPVNRTVHGEIGMTFEQVYVSPALEGWTLVFADYPALDGGGGLLSDRQARGADAMARCEKLSRRFGAAQWYAQCFDGYDDRSGWIVCENGEIARYCFYAPGYFDLPGEEVLIGPPGDPDADTEALLGDLRAWLAERGTSGKQPPPAPVPPASREEEVEEPEKAEVWQPWLDWEFTVSKVAWRLSVSPEAFGPDMRVTGTGVLAVPRALRDRPRYGALPI